MRTQEEIQEKINVLTKEHERLANLNTARTYGRGLAESVYDRINMLKWVLNQI